MAVLALKLVSRSSKIRIELHTGLAMMEGVSEITSACNAVTNAKGKIVSH